jgi:hypothetical protein
MTVAGNVLRCFSWFRLSRVRVNNVNEEQLLALEVEKNVQMKVYLTTYVPFKAARINLLTHQLKDLMCTSPDRQ